MIVDIQCPNCRARMTVLWDTEWTDGKQRTVDVLCERCLHRETVFLGIEQSHKQERGDSNAK